MKKQILIFIFSATSLALFAQNLANFENISLSPNSVENASGESVSGKFINGGITFNNTYQTAYGGFWSDGWAYSNIKNDTDANFTNLYASYANSGYNNSAKYAIGQQGSMLRLNTSDSVLGLYVTNGTYPALTIKNGNAFAKQFGGTSGNDPDYFYLNIKAWRNGALVNDSVVFYLADYRFTNNTQDYIIKNWTWVDLTILGVVDSLKFNLASSDEGQFGINTPLFFCVDDIVTKTDTATFEALNLANKVWNKPSAIVRKNYESGNISFASAYTVSHYGDFWSRGFAISNKTDSSTTETTAGLTKIYTAITGKGFDSSSNYAIAQQNAVLKPIGTAVGKRPVGFYITNSNYTYLSMKWGDAFSRKFSDTDYFMVKAIGLKNGIFSDSTSVYLAKNDTLVDTWKWVDLAKWKSVDSVIFRITSSDVGQFGMNTPGFFAIDNFTFSNVNDGLAKSNLHTLQATVYPNPAKQFINISVTNQNAANVSVSIYNLAGKLLLNQRGVEQPIMLNILPAGLYVVRIETDIEATVQKLIVE